MCRRASGEPLDAEFSRSDAIDSAGTANLSTLRLDELDAVIFDFNGTLSDDEGILMDLIIRLARELCGVELDEEHYKTDLLGRSDIEIATALLASSTMQPGYSVDGVVDQLNRRYTDRIASRHLVRPESPALLAALSEAGVKLAVVTGASRSTVEPALRRAGILTAFAAVVDEDVTAGKPDPEGLRLAAALLELDEPARVAVFEDSIPGLRAVRAAGMIPIAIVGIHSASEFSGLATRIVTDLGKVLAELRLPAPHSA